MAAENAYVPPQERSWRRHVIMIAGFALLLVGAFVVGAVINSDDAPKNAPAPVTDTAATDEPVTRARRSDLTLVPVTDGTGFEQPITSAPISNPAEGIPTEYQRRDATAVSSVEYAALAQRAQAERQAQQQTVDPRSITGPAYAQGRPPQPPRTAQATPPPQEQMPPSMTSDARDTEEELEPEREPSAGRDRTPSREPARVVASTRPVPQHQPLPSIDVDETVTARLRLTVGPDGRVKQIHIQQSIPGHTPALIAAVQKWRFKPATENGVPVAAPFTVDISFKPR